MTNFLIWFRDWIKDPKNQRNLTIIIAIIIILLMRSCSPSKGEINSLKQNVFALNDSIRTYKTKTGILVYEKGALITENGNLKSLNKGLSDEVKYLKDNPIVIIKTKIVIKHDTIEVPVYISNPVWNEDGSVSRELKWSYDKDFGKGNSRKLSGKIDVTVDTSMNLTSTPVHITDDEFSIAITTGLTENKDGLLEIFVKSDYPGFNVSELDGALIDPKKSDVLKKYFPPKKWSLGLYTGFGPYVDPFNSKIGMGVQMGVGLQYNLIQWNFKK
jgi:hypothetical protein